MMNPSPAAVLTPSSAAFPWRLLGIAAEEPAGSNWLIRLQTELEGDLRLTWATSIREALQELRQSAYSGVVLGDLPSMPGAPMPPAEEFVQALRATGDPTPVVVLIPLPLDEHVAALLKLGCEVCVTPRLWDSPALPLTLARAVRGAHQRWELDHLRGVHQRRLAREQTDATALMQLQQQSLQRLIPPTPITVTATMATRAQRNDGPEEQTYEALLRSYLVSPATALDAEITALVDGLERGGWGPQDVRELHVERLQRLLEGLGGRASRQVLARADVLALDVITRLGERYRQRAAM